MNDAGLTFTLKRLLSCKTKKEADTFIADLGNEYRPLMQQVLGRMVFERTTSQNSLLHKWFTEVGKQMGEGMDEVKARAKLDIGCAILRRDSVMFDGFFAKCIAELDRERQIKAMKYISVTSLMNTKQATEFADTFERIHRAEGYQLTIPKDAA